MTRTIEQIKTAGRFYKAGSIIPERALSTRPKAKRHLIKFASDCWVIGVSKSGSMVVAVDCKEVGSIFAIPYLVRGVTCVGGKYVSGNTHWVGNTNMTDDQWAESIEKELSA